MDAHLELVEGPFEIYSDHQSLQHFQHLQRLTLRMIRWPQDLNQHQYTICYRPAS